MYDIIIIGGGSAGYRAAELAGKQGKNTLLVEKKAVGGTCLHEGCIPMKAYLHICTIKKKMERLITSGIISNTSGSTVNLDVVATNVSKTVMALEKGILAGLRSVGVEVLQGTAKILSASSEYVTINVDGKLFECKKLIIATGSVPVTFSDENIGLSYNIINSSDIFAMKNVPKKIYIIGGGAVGLEMASLFNSLGAEVTVVEYMPTICGGMDNELAQVLQKLLEKQKIHFLTNTKLEKFRQSEVLFRSADKNFSANPECVLVAVGRKPLIMDLGLENIGVDFSEKGIVTNDYCRTSHPLVYACGDVTGKMMLAHVAYAQAKVAVDNICGENSAVNYDIIPKIIYSMPTYISVGFSEEYCRAESIPYLAQSLPMTYNGKYYVENGMDGGKAKLIVSTDTHRILGFHAVGLDMTELAAVAGVMIENRLRLDDVRNMIFPHPTFGEIIQTLADGI